MADIPISYITNQSATSTSGNATTAPKNQLDGEGFMKLLLAQLKYQDPNSPMDTTAMMQQTSTLSMVEQMTAMADDSAQTFALQQRMAATQLVGQQVTWADPTTGNATSGVVSSVAFTSSGAFLKVGTTNVPLAAVSSVTAAPAATTPATSSSAS